VPEEPPPIPSVAVDPVPEGTALIETGQGHQVPRQFAATYDDPSRPFYVYVIVSVLDDRVPVIRQLTLKVRDEDLGYRPPSSDDLRLPMASILDAAVRAAAHAVKAREQAATEPVERPRTRYVLTPARLDEVAEVVRDATEQGVPIRRAVAEHFGLKSEYTARNWIAAAKDRDRKRRSTEPEEGHE